jgi:CspA family cold shock protein
MASMNGTIKRLVSDKGFGFILAGDGFEYFFHNSACQQTAFDDLREGQTVTFDVGQGPERTEGRERQALLTAFVTCGLSEGFRFRSRVASSLTYGPSVGAARSSASD